ncbi:sensor histidine kinase [Thiobacter aerophilum]|uniref:histidine kinase n=1 Tax=Thiobacter aerophilum TaxID=3121275 RepID=A0ABV0EFW2_9BURK
MPNGVSLRGQLLGWLLLPLFLLLSVAAFLVYSETVKLTTLAYDRALFDSTRALSRQVQVRDGRIEVDLPAEARAILRYDERDTIYFQVKDAAGRVIAGDHDMPVPPAALHRVDLPIFYDAKLNGRSVRVAAVFIPSPLGTGTGETLIQVAETVFKRDSIMRDALVGIVVMQLCILASTALLVWLGVRQGLAPLDGLQAEIASRSHLDLRAVPERDAPLEVRPLVRSINDLLQRLEANIDAQRRFIAYAAHQLRTPLAGIKTQAELALRETTPQAMRHALEQLHISAERATHLANQLLALARAEPGALSETHFCRLDLTRLVKEASIAWVPEALSKGIDLGYEGSSVEVMVRGDPLLLREMVNNLLDNAIRYCPPGTQVTARVMNEGRPTLVIEDDGPGIPAPDRDRVFQRFYRAVVGDVGGTGLGLAIVADGAKAHGASVRLESLDGASGTRITIVFPPAQE